MTKWDIMYVGVCIVAYSMSVSRVSVAASAAVNCDNCLNASCTDSCPGDCISGFFGEGCNKACPEFCYEGLCDKTSGRCYMCEDKQNHFGLYCNNTCPANCPGHCSTSGNEHECYQCNSGWTGAYCDRRCSQANCAQCLQSTDSCVECESGYTELQCDKPCSNQNCAKCKSDGFCSGCIDGLYGIGKCDLVCPRNCRECSLTYDNHGKCLECTDGWYGPNCDTQCIDNCKLCFDDSTCTECEAGYYGDTCTIMCPDGCETCARDGTCKSCTDKEDKSGSKCQCSIDQCATYKTKLRWHCTSCKNPNWYIQKETLGSSNKACCPCSSNCTSGCDSTTGDCIGGCRSGYYGPQCDKQMSTHCINNAFNTTTGVCDEGCQDGWFKPACDIECKTYFPNCKKCSTECDQCDPGYGKYEKGWFPGFPIRGPCRPCESCADSACNTVYDDCQNGCSQGWFPGSNGLCSDRCPTGCRTDRCDSTIGKCLDGCRQGYYGDTCMECCHKNCVNDTCDLSQTYGTCKCIPGYKNINPDLYFACDTKCDSDVCDTSTATVPYTTINLLYSIICFFLCKKYMLQFM